VWEKTLQRVTEGREAQDVGEMAYKVWQETALKKHKEETDKALDEAT